MASTVQELVAIPADLQDRLEQLCDKLQRLVDGALTPGLIPVLANEASVLQPQLAAAGCAKQAAFLLGAICHMTTAAERWTAICANPTTSTTTEFEDSVFQAYDEACWALTWEDPSNHGALPAGVEVIDLQSAA